MRIQLFTIIALLLGGGCIEPPETSGTMQASTVEPVLTVQSSGVTVRLASIAPVDERVVWIAGSFGTVLRTTDGGATWVVRPVPGAEALAFRDIHAVDADTAFVLSNNGGANARIYKTTDGGATWTLFFQNPIPGTFYDCFAFWNRRRAVAFPDAENGRFDVIRMTDGQTWDNIGDAFGTAQPGEGLFPTSGDCVTTLGGRRAWAVIAGASPSRVFATEDGGDSWTSYPIPIAGAPTAGGMNVLFRDPWHGMVAGGNVATPTVAQDNFARSSDGGRTWALATPTPFPGAAFGLAYIADRHDDDDDRDDDCGERAHPILATGPGGAAWSRDEGDTWELLPGVSAYFAVEFASPRTGWLVGTAGKILRIDF